MEHTPTTEITFEDLMSLDGDFKLPETDIPAVPPTSQAAPDVKIDIADLTKVGEIEQLKEPVVEIKKEEPSQEAPAPATIAPIYLNISKKFLEDGKWEDMLIDDNGKEIKLSEATELDEELFLKVYEAQDAARKEDIEKDYVSVKGVDDNKLKLINIIKNGGDLKDIFQDPSQIKRPFEGADLSNEQYQKSIVYNQFLRQGLSQEEAKELTEKAAKDLTLETKTDSIVKAYQKHYDDTLALKEKEIIAERQAEETAIKEYRKNLSLAYKEEGLSEHISKKFVDAATKRDAEGNLAIDTIYEKLMEDPKEAKELVFFMLEKENYLKARGAKIKQAEQVDFMRKVSIIRDTASKVTPKVSTEIPATDPFSQIEF